MIQKCFGWGHLCLLGLIIAKPSPPQPPTRSRVLPPALMAFFPSDVLMKPEGNFPYHRSVSRINFYITRSQWGIFFGIIASLSLSLLVSSFLYVPKNYKHVPYQMKNWSWSSTLALEKLSGAVSVSMDEAPPPLQVLWGKVFSAFKWQFVWLSKSGPSCQRAGKVIILDSRLACGSSTFIFA